MSKFGVFQDRLRLLALDGAQNRANDLKQKGRPLEALRVLEVVAGIDPQDYEDEQSLRRVVQRKLAIPGRELEIEYLGFLCNALANAGRTNDALGLFAAGFDLEWSLLANPAAVCDELEQKLRRKPDQLLRARLYFGRLLFDSSNFIEALQVLAAYRGDPPFQSQEGLSKTLDSMFGEVDLDLQAAYIMIWSLALNSASREKDASALCQAFAILRQRKEDNKRKVSFLAEFTEIIHELQSLPAKSTAEQIDALAQIEARLGLNAQCYEDPDSLSTRLDEVLDEVQPELRAGFVTILAPTLHRVKRTRDALTLIEADCHIGKADRLDPDNYLAKIRLRLDSLSTNGRSTYSRLVAICFDELGLGYDLLGTATCDLDTFTRDLRREISRLGPFTGCAHALGVLRLLRAHGEAERARECLQIAYEEILLPDFGAAVPMDGMRSELWESWLAVFGKEGTYEPIESCRAILKSLRSGTSQPSTFLSDRESMWHQVDRLRRRLIEVGFHWAEERFHESADSNLWLEVQLWDLELSQRVLLERFVLQETRSALRKETAVQSWPFVSQPKPPLEFPLPPPRLFSIGALEDLGSIPSRRKSNDSNEPPALLSPNTSHPTTAIRARIAQGIEQNELIGLIGSNGVFLRAMCGSEGELHWTALAVSEGKLEVLMHGNGPPGSCERLHWATVRHDLRLYLARYQAKIDRARAEVIKVVAKVLELLEEKLAKGDDEVLTGRSTQLEAWLFDCLDELSEKNEADLKVIREILFLIWQPPSGSSLVRWAILAQRELARIRLLVEKASSGLDGHELRSALNAATNDFAAEVNAVWQFGDLGNFLPPECDLVYQLDDALNAVPISLLSVGGRPLFQCVSSLRSHFTLLSIAWEGTSVGRSDASRLLAISHCQQNDPAIDGAVWLHHGLGKVAKAFGIESLHAAEQPAGALGTLVATLDDLRVFDVIAVYGHGDRRQHGVYLADCHSEPDFQALWKGQGCDFSNVAWLWMVSCSIGRLEENRNRDVDGFCIELALHRASSVAAFRWPVNALEASAFTIEAIRRYLELRKDLIGSQSAALRARALNDTRKLFLGDAKVPPLLTQASLSTVAACELFGLG